MVNKKRATSRTRLVQRRGDVVAFRIYDLELLRAIDARATKEQRPRSEMIRVLLTKALQD